MFVAEKVPLLLVISLAVKVIKNGCRCIVEIRGTQGWALVGDPAWAVGECRDVAIGRIHTKKWDILEFLKDKLSTPSVKLYGAENQIFREN